MVIINHTLTFLMLLKKERYWTFRVMINSIRNLSQIQIHNHEKKIFNNWQPHKQLDLFFFHQQVLKQEYFDSVI